MEKEIWKDIPEFEGYQASNLGRIKSFKIYKEKGVFLKFNKHNGESEYLVVSMSLPNKKRVERYVHRLICSTFHEKPLNKNIVNHIDFNIENNRADNLEWTDHAGNNQHAYDNNLRNAPTGKGRKVGQISNGKVIAIYPSVRQASLTVKVSDTASRAVCGGKKKTAKSFSWIYID